MRREFRTAICKTVITRRPVDERVILNTQQRISLIKSTLIKAIDIEPQT